MLAGFLGVYPSQASHMQVTAAVKMVVRDVIGRLQRRRVFQVEVRVDQTRGSEILWLVFVSCFYFASLHSLQPGFLP